VFLPSQAKGSRGRIVLSVAALLAPNEIAAAVIPERRSLIRDRNTLKRLSFTIPVRASLGRDDNPLARLAKFA
jgi:hypothetical protein